MDEMRIISMVVEKDSNGLWYWNIILKDDHGNNGSSRSSSFYPSPALAAKNLAKELSNEAWQDHRGWHLRDF